MVKKVSRVNANYYQLLVAAITFARPRVLRMLGRSLAVHLWSEVNARGHFHECLHWCLQCIYAMLLLFLVADQWHFQESPHCWRRVLGAYCIQCHISSSLTGHLQAIDTSKSCALLCHVHLYIGLFPWNSSLFCNTCLLYITSLFFLIGWMPGNRMLCLCLQSSMIYSLRPRLALLVYIFKKSLEALEDSIGIGIQECQLCNYLLLFHDAATGKASPWVAPTATISVVSWPLRSRCCW